MIEMLEYNGLTIGRSKECGYILQTINPNDFDVDRTTANIYDTDGMEILNTLYSDRIVSVSGMIYSKSRENMLGMKRELYKRLDGKQMHMLTYYTRSGNYCANAVGTVKSVTKHGYLLDFSVEFTIPGFYFLSTFPTTIMPVVDTELNINNYSGDVKSPIKITLKSLNAFTKNLNSYNKADYCSAYYWDYSNAITITADDNTLKFGYILSKDEIVTIENMCAISSLRGNVSKYISLDSDVPYVQNGSNVLIKNNQSNIIDQQTNSSAYTNTFTSEIEYSERYIGV